MYPREKMETRNEYKQFVPKNGYTDWYESRVKELGAENLKSFIHQVYTRFYIMGPNSTKRLDDFKAKNTELLMQIVCLFIEETQSYKPWSEYQYEFVDDYTAVKRLGFNPEVLEYIKDKYIHKKTREK